MDLFTELGNLLNPAIAVEPITEEEIKEINDKCPYKGIINSDKK